MGARKGPPLQHQQAPRRPLRQGHLRATSTGKPPSSPTTSTSGDDTKRDDAGLRRRRPQEQSSSIRHFDWGDDCPPDIPLSDSVIYEVNVRGFSVSATPCVPENLRGTYAGLASEASINYLKKLGITAVELLPVHHFIDEGHLVDRGLRDYWGYNTLGYFAPMSRYSSCGDNGGQVDEFKEMVKALHKEGIEVILDVVYNHTCEGNRIGPDPLLKGIDNTTYYRQVADNPRYYMDYTGTGNTLNVMPSAGPQAGHGLAALLGHGDARRRLPLRPRQHPRARAARRRPSSPASSTPSTRTPPSQTSSSSPSPGTSAKAATRSATSPSSGPSGTASTATPSAASGRATKALLSDFAYRLTGSSDLYQSDGRKPYASINFITAHDGFTLCDLVSYNEKHNEANGDNNTDGANDNDTWNMGAEGPTDDPAINELRERQTRNFLATLILSQGVPMICGGDEVARSQRGNNNGYCQDNELTWYDWKLDAPRQRLMEFTAKLIELRRNHPNLHRRKFFQDRTIRGSRRQGHRLVRHRRQRIAR